MNKMGDIRIPPLSLKENSELECWNEFILRFEIALINTPLALTTFPGQSDDSRGKSKAASSTERDEALEEQNDFKRGGLLLNSIGDDGYRIFTRWNIKAHEIRYTNLINRFQTQFKERQNIFITRHRFLSMEQLSTESIETFIDRVTKAASFCQLAALEDDMVLQVIVRGLKDDQLRKELLGTSDVNLTKAMNLCKLFVKAEKSNTVLTRTTDIEVAYVKEGKRKQTEKTIQKKDTGCFLCKSTSHWIKDCPKRKELHCTKCNKKGHTQKYCKSKRVQEITTEPNDPGLESDESF